MTGHYVPVGHARAVGAVRRGARTVRGVARVLGLSQSRAWALIQSAADAGVMACAPGLAATLTVPRDDETPEEWAGRRAGVLLDGWRHREGLPPLRSDRPAPRPDPPKVPGREERRARLAEWLAEREESRQSAASEVADDRGTAEGG